MKHWKCTECGGKEIKVSMDEVRLYLSCLSCNDVEYVKRTNQWKMKAS